MPKNRYRKRPRPHTVRSHVRKGSGVNAYPRGSGSSLRTNLKPKGIKGRFISGTKYVQTKEVTVDGKTYDTKTWYFWTDPDFPHDSDVQKAIHKAKINGEKEPRKAWVDYVNWSKQEHRFKVSSFMTYKGNVDALPIASLGRIPVKELKTE